MASSVSKYAATPESNGKTIKTRILIISDTHAGAYKEFTPPAFLPKADILIHSGDLTMIGKLSEHQKAIELIKNVDAELKLVIPGNHDLTLDRIYSGRKDRHTFGEKDLYAPENLQQIRELYEGAEASGAGIHYMEEGVESFTLSTGAKFTVYASAYTPEFYGWAFPYPRHQDRFNPPTMRTPESDFTAQTPIPSYPEIDIVITHGPPEGILDVTKNGSSAGCHHLLNAVQRVKPRLHCFGHIHEGWGATRMNWLNTSGSEIERGEKVGLGEMCFDRGVAVVDISRSGRPLEFGKETLFVNASIMNLIYQPSNAPWIVDMELPC